MDDFNFDTELANIAKAESELSARRAAIRSQVIEHIQDLVNKHGISASDIRFPDNSHKAAAVECETRPVKYRDSEGNTWTGRGRQPKWLKDAISNGAKLEDYLI